MPEQLRKYFDRIFFELYDPEQHLLRQSKEAEEEGRISDARLYLEGVLLINPDNKAASEKLDDLVEQTAPKEQRFLLKIGNNVVLVIRSVDKDGFIAVRIKEKVSGPGKLLIQEHGKGEASYKGDKPKEKATLVDGEELIDFYVEPDKIVVFSEDAESQDISLLDDEGKVVSSESINDSVEFSISMKT